MIKLMPILILLCCSCAYRAPAWHGTMRDIGRKPYVPVENDCLDKAQDFQEKHDGYILHVTQQFTEVTHALNHIDGWVIDCTRGRYYKIWDTVEETVHLYYGGRIINYNYIERIR